MPGTAGWHPAGYEWYFRTPLGAAIRRAEEAAILGFLDRVCRPGDRVLEVGPGTGNYTTNLARRGATVVAVEPSPEMRGYLEERLAAEGITGIETRAGSLPRDLGVDGPFDGAITIGVLNYVAAVDRALAALAERLRPGGWLVFNLPVRTLEGRIYAFSELLSRRRIGVYAVDEAERLTEDAGLRVEEMLPAGLSRGGLTLVILATQTDAARASAPAST